MTKAILQSLKVEELKTIIRSYNLHTKIKMTKRTKADLVDDLDKHVYFDNGDIKLKSGNITSINKVDKTIKDKQDKKDKEEKDKKDKEEKDKKDKEEKDKKDKEEKDKKDKEENIETKNIKFMKYIVNNGTNEKTTIGRDNLFKLMAGMERYSINKKTDDLKQFILTHYNDDTELFKITIKYINL